MIASMANYKSQRIQARRDNNELRLFNIANILSFAVFSPFELDGLNAHNKVRKTHNAPPMTLKRTMCDEAKRYATEIASKVALKHSSNLNGQGENLSMACVSGGRGQGSAQNALQATTEW